MTSKTDKLRAVFLTALMIGSVFAAGIAFTGSAAAADITDATVDPGDAESHVISVGDDGGLDQAHNLDITYNLTADETLNATLDVSELTATGVSVNSTSVDSPSANIEDVEYDEDSSELTFEVNDDGTGLDAATVNVDFGLDTEDGETDNRVIHEYSDDDGNTQDIVVKTIDEQTVIQSDDAEAEVFSGQVITFADAGNDVTSVEVFSTDSDGNRDSREANLNTTPGDVINYDSGGLEEGDYIVEWNDGDDITNLTVSDLGLTAELDSNTVTNEQSIGITTSSNEPLGEYTAYVFEAGADISEDEPLASQDGTFDGSGESSESFAVDGDITAGSNYTVVVEHTSSGVTAQTDEVQVTEAADADAEFVGDASAVRGDIGTVNVSLTSTSTATVQLGTGEKGYQTNVTVEDGDGDGYVAFDVNTYRMGGPQTDAYESGDAFSVVNDDDSITVDDGDADSDLPRVIAADNYQMTAMPGTSDSASDVTQFRVREGPNLNGQTLQTAPGTYSLGDVAESGAITDDSDITWKDNRGDYVIHTFDTSGIYGLIANQTGNSFAAQAYNAINGTNQLDLTLTQTEATTNANSDPMVADVDDLLAGDDATILANQTANTMWVVYDVEAVDDHTPGVEFGDGFNASLQLNTTSMMVQENVSVSGEYTISEPDTELNYDTDNYQVTNASGQTIEGTTNLADGTNLTIRASSDDVAGDGFIKSVQDVQVQDGEFSGELDFSDTIVDDTFTLSVDDSNGNTQLSGVSGVVVESVDDGDGDTTTTEEPDDTTTEEPDDTTTEEPDDTTTEAPDDTTTEAPDDDTTEAPSDDGGDDGGESGGSIPGFGVGVALVALLGAALLALRE